MSDQLGPITIPDPVVIGAFPLVGNYGGGMDLDIPIAIHSFDQPGLKTEQRFVLGDGARRFRFRKDHLSCGEYDSLKAHWAQAQGVYAQFPYTYKRGGTRADEVVTVRYENPAISFPHMVGMVTGDPGVTLLEVATTHATYTSVATLTRFPDTTLTPALTQQTQHLIPLVTLQLRDTKNSDGSYTHWNPIYISNQRFTLDGIGYLPRLLNWSGISQSIGESSDNAQFTFGNADSVWSQLVNQVNLERTGVGFALYHVESKYIVRLWSGYSLPWTFDTEGHFMLGASDGAYELSLGYPMRTVSRTCWKVYKGPFCPSTADPTAFPDCPKSWEACNDRGVPLSFGGMVVGDTRVRIKDNSTGILGFGRTQFTSVTVVDDTVYQRPVQEIYTDIPMQLNCDVAAGRDESDYYSALGIVGEGPISGYDPNLILQRLDGQPPHDPLRGGGWRGIPGNDPCITSEFFALDQAPWNQVPTGSTYAAGLAFAEIRRTDEAGLQLSAVSDRSMQVTVTGGIGGWTWTAPGARVWTPALSNWVWVLINVYLRARGLRVDLPRVSAVSTAQMEACFDVNQAIATAAIADLVVDKLIGTGQERQFPFRGILKERKPLKDWLQEICNGGLGYYTFVDGKLWVGIRINSSVLAGNAYTRDSILFKSLQVTPHQPRFNWLVGQFGDEEFLFNLNSVTIYDIDHASYTGTPQSPEYRTNTMTFVGISNKSQCARVITTRLREELGGATLAEYLAARDFAFKTTVLGLQTMAGDIISLNHTLVPNGRIEGRVQKWTLNPDFSIDIMASPTTDSMYDLDSGPKPDDVNAPPVIPEQLPSINGLTWMPNEVGPVTGDPLYPDILQRTFDVWQDYQVARDGSWAAAIYVAGEMCINDFALGQQPRIMQATLGAGGSLNGPMTIYIAITQRLNTLQPLTPSNLIGLWIPAGVTNQKVMLAISASPDSDPPWDLWAGSDRRAIARQSSGTNVQPSITFSGPIHNMTEGMPEAAARKVAIAAKQVWHSGVAGVSVTTVTAPNKIQCNDFKGSVDNWNGRILSALADQSDGSAPLWNFTVTGFTSATGEFTVTPNCVVASPADSVQTGDVLIVRSMGISSSANSVGDPLWNNFVARNQFGSPGLRPDEEKGRIARIRFGTGAGQYRYITGNTATVITVTPNWDIIPDPTSVITVEAADWIYQARTSDLDVPTEGTRIEIRMSVDNLRQKVALVAGFLVDDQERFSDEIVAPMREIFLYGQPPTVRVVGPGAGPWTVDPTDQTIRVDTSANDVTVQLLPIADYQGRTLYFSNDVGPKNAIVTCAAGELLFDGKASVTLAPSETVRVTAG